MSQSKYSALTSEEAPLHSDTIWEGEISDKGRSRLILLPFCLVTVFIAFIVLSFLIIRPNALHNTLSPDKILPQFPSTQVEWKNDFKWQDTGLEGDQLWNDLMPIGNGFIRVPNPRKYNIHPSAPIQNDKENAEEYGISAFHQLHCLGMLRDVLITYEQGGVSKFMEGGHPYHCLDYLRQAVFCMADTTLEYGMKGWDGELNKTAWLYGGGTSTHRCQDWSAVVGYAVAHRTGDKRNLLSSKGSVEVS